MFTGIVEEIGTVRAVARRAGSARLEVACATVLEGTTVGASIAVNGCCLTVTDLVPGAFAADLMGETLDRTALGGLRAGHPVNLERALSANGRLGGHLVQGHVDGVGEVAGVEPQDGWTIVRVAFPRDLAPYLVEKGSVAVDGTSLTVMAVDDATFAVGLIPHTLEVTVLGRRAVGDRVNLETDIVAKYVERLVRAGAATPYARSN